MANRFSPATWADRISFRMPHGSRSGLVFAHFKPRGPAHPSAGGTGRPGLSVYQGRRRTVKTLRRQPQVAAHLSHGIQKGRQRLGVPSRCAMGRGSLLPQQVSRRRDPGEEPHDGWRCTGNGSVRSLAVGLHPQVSPRLLKGELQLPAQDKPFQDLGRVRRWVGTEQGLCGVYPVGVPDQYPAQGRGRPPARYNTAACG